MKTVVYTGAAIKQLRKLPGDVRDRLIAKLKRYAETGAGDVTALKGRPRAARLRVGDYRLIFIETADQISVRAAGDRKEIYD